MVKNIFYQMRARLVSLATITILAGTASYLYAIPSVSVKSYSTVSTSGLTLASNATYGCQINGLSFQQDIITSFNGYQYVAYYSGSRYVNIARKALPDGAWENIEFTDYYFSGDDAHNTISMGICPNDGTIHLAFDHHGENLHYRVSQTGVATDPANYTWSASLFGSVTDTLESSAVTLLTYPAFLRTPDGNMQLLYRYRTSGDGIWHIYDYDGETHKWSNDRAYIDASGYYSDSLGSSTTRCAYPNYYCYDDLGRLQVSWCWRESAAGANHDVVYALSNDQGHTWYNSKFTNLSVSINNSDGTKKNDLINLCGGLTDANIVANTSGKIIGVTTDSTVVQKLDRAYGMMNQQAHACDPQGRPHIVMWHCTDESLQAAGSYAGETRWGPATARYYHHYWQDLDGTWNHTQIPGYAGSRPKLLMRNNGDAILIYQACRTVESLGEEIYFINGDLKVYAATAESKWTDWQEVYELARTGAYCMNEMLADVQRFKDSNSEILSVFIQDAPTSSRQSTAIRVLDLQVQ